MSSPDTITRVNTLVEKLVISGTVQDEGGPGKVVKKLIDVKPPMLNLWNKKADGSTEKR